MLKKKYLKFKILKNFRKYDYCFFIITGKFNLLNELFDNGSVLHISNLRGLFPNIILYKYWNSFICFFNYNKFFSILHYLKEKNILINKVCITKNFINLFNYKIFDYNYIYYKVVFINYICFFIYVFLFYIKVFLINIMNLLYKILEKNVK